jgi:cytochrome c oxidase subunit 2
MPVLRSSSIVRRAPFLAALLAGCALVQQPALAQEETRAEALATQAIIRKPDRARGAQLYRKNCSDCHGRKAWGDASNAIPALAGQHFSYLVKQMADFAELERDVPEMHRLFAKPKLATPQSLADLAEYLSLLLPNPEPARGDGRALATGGRVFESSCAECHGASGQGSDADMIPLLRGQPYSYLLLQMRSLVTGHRGNTFTEMPEAIDLLDRDEMSAVADFITRLTPPTPETE